jgi:hypothetical protein
VTLPRTMRVIQHYEHRDGFPAIVCARNGRLHFARSPIDSPVFPTVDDAVNWSIDIIEENAARMGPFAKALIERYSRPVSVIEVI